MFARQQRNQHLAPQQQLLSSIALSSQLQLLQNFIVTAALFAAQRPAPNKDSKNHKALCSNAKMHAALDYVAPATTKQTQGLFSKSYEERNKLNQEAITNITYQPTAFNPAPESFMAREAFKLADAAKNMFQGNETDYNTPDELYTALGDFLAQRPIIIESNGFNPIKELLQGAMKTIQPAVSDTVQLNYQHQMPTNAQSPSITPLPSAFDY